MKIAVVLLGLMSFILPAWMEAQCISLSQTVSEVTALVSTDAGCGGSQHYNVTDKTTDPPTMTYISVAMDVQVPALCAGNWYDCQCSCHAQYSEQL